jgi:hypothetical protein
MLLMLTSTRLPSDTVAALLATRLVITYLLLLYLPTDVICGHNKVDVHIVLGYLNAHKPRRVV